MKWIVYETICKVNNKIYIGVHRTEDPEIFDGYIGNGINIYHSNINEPRNSHFRSAVKKYGYHNFVRTTIKVFDNELDAYALEKEIVNEEFLKRDDVYNLALGGQCVYGTQKRKVYMYDLDGNFEREFDGVNEAGIFLNPKARGAGHLPRAIKEGHLFLGHQFSYEKLPYMKKLKHRNLTTVERPYVGKKVGRFTEDGTLVQVYETMTDCVKDGYKNAKQVALGKRHLCKGFTFKYLD